jgi:hypothetical protein
MQPTSLNPTSLHLISVQQAMIFLNQLQGRLEDAETITQLQVVNAELINFSTTAGFAHLPSDILQRWDGLQYQAAELEESALIEQADHEGRERSPADLQTQWDRTQAMNPVELKELAQEYVERLDRACTLEHQAHLFLSTAFTDKGTAFDRYEDALNQGASKEEWNAAVQAIRTQLHHYHAEELASIAVKVLNSAETNEVWWNGKVITFIHDERRLMILDDEGHHLINATWMGENWEHQPSNLDQAVFLRLKQEIATHLSEIIQARDTASQSDPAILELA